MLLATFGGRFFCLRASWFAAAFVDFGLCQFRVFGFSPKENGSANSRCELLD
jgi:hypothetical protein